MQFLQRNTLDWIGQQGRSAARDHRNHQVIRLGLGKQFQHLSGGGDAALIRYRVPGFADLYCANLGRTAIAFFDDHQPIHDPAAKLIHNRLGHRQPGLASPDQEDAPEAAQGVSAPTQMELIIHQVEMAGHRLVRVYRLDGSGQDSGNILPMGMRLEACGEELFGFDHIWILTDLSSSSLLY